MNSIIIGRKRVGKLVHEATGLSIAVYKHINWFQSFMIKTCFGLKYEPDKRDKKK